MQHPRAIAIPILILVVAGCGAPTSSAGPATSPSPTAGQPGSQSPSPAATPATAPPARLLDGQPMRSCYLNGHAALCGTLRVPEDRSTPSGRQIDLRVVVLPARGTRTEPDPVFFLAGGPGGAATAAFNWAASTFSAVNAARDLVLVDQRGTGGSNRLVVPPQPDTSAMDGAERESTLRAWLADVLAEMPGDPRFYTTSVAMDDLDAVRAALGYDRINLYGPSYGATAAQYYLRQHEDRVRAVVLDGATLIDVPIFERVAANSQRALDLLFDRCATDPACGDAFPDVRAEFATVVERLAEAPVATSVIHPWTGEPIVIDPISFASAVHGALVDSVLASQIPALIHAAFLGEWDVVAQASVSTASSRPLDDDQLVMSVVIRCSEAWARYDPAEVARLGAGSYDLEAQLAAARDQAETCRYVPAGIVPADDADPVRSAVPVLLVLGDADPQDPPGNVADAPVELPNSLTVVVPGQGHTVGHLGCMPSIIADFIEAGTVAGLDVACAASEVPTPTFRTTN